MSSRSAYNSSGHVLLKLQADMSCSSSCNMSRHVFISQSALCMLDKHLLNNGVYAPALRFIVGMCQTMMVGGLAVTITRLVCNLGWNNFHFNTMSSVALLAISSFGILILLSFNTDPPVKFLRHNFGCTGN